MADHPQIIGLSGVARAGKDTVGDILRQLYGYETKSFSDVLNQALIALNPMISLNPEEVDEFGNTTRLSHEKNGGWTRYAILESVVGYEKAKDQPEVRALLQRLGTEVGRNLLGQDIWVDAMFSKIDPTQKIAIVNVRFPNEYEAVKSRGGVVWKVTRPGYEAALGHVSDTALDGYDFDHVISNDGTKHDLAMNVMSLLDPVQTTFR